MTDKLITHEEAREAHARLFDSYLYGDFIPFPTRSDLDTIKEYIIQQEQFAKDVARYFELTELRAYEAIFGSEYLFTDDDWRELNYLEEKLSKVGKEE